MNDTITWYSTLIKPSWSPPAWLFGPVWTALYAIIVVSYGTVFYQVATKRLPAWVAVPFVLNLVFNLSFTWLQFGLKNNLLATADILLVLGTLVWALWAINVRIPWVAYVNLPYLLWVAFATVLQITITVMNR